MYCIVFIHFYSASHSLRLSEALPTTAIDAVTEFHAETLEATASEGFSKGPQVPARAGFELATNRSKGIDSTNAPPRILPPLTLLQPDRNLPRTILWTIQLIWRSASNNLVPYALLLSGALGVWRLWLRLSDLSNYRPKWHVNICYSAPIDRGAHPR